MRTIGIVLVVLGILALVYGGINYTKNRTVLHLGDVNITATEHKSIRIPAVVGVVVLGGGIALLATGRRRAGPA
jgi:hypothetical protein